MSTIFIKVLKTISIHCRSLHRSNLKKAFDTVNHEIILDKLDLFISFFLYLITSTICRGTHNRAGLQFKCVLTDNPPGPGEVDYTTGVYVPYSFRIVVWVLLRPTRTNQISESAVRRDLIREN